MKTLQEIYENYTTPDGNGDKGTAHSYIEVYSDILKKYRNGCTFIEIGVAGGLSMLMWQEYFENSKLFGVDIAGGHNKSLWEQKYTFIEIDATKPEFLEKIEGVTFDVVIDDGSHIKEDQFASYNLLKNRMNKGGIYIIEDVVNIDSVKYEFQQIDPSKKVTILDRRHIKNRYDDVLIIIEDKE